MAEIPMIQEGTDRVNRRLLGSVLCWAVVFANIGSSVYYVPGLLYGTTHSLAGFFVLLVMPVFVLLALKYAEVTYRFPNGGAVTMAAQGINRWFGALVGLFLLVSYFFTAAISSFSAVRYLSIVLRAISQPFITLCLAIAILLLLGILNWIGAIKDVAKVVLIGAIIAFVSNIAILYTVFTHISFSYFFSLFPVLFKNQAFRPFFTLTGFASAFLAISGLESISQLSSRMKTPYKKTASTVLLLTVLTVALTSPLLIMLSILLLPHEAVDPILSTQLISRLGGHWGDTFLQTEVAISASVILIFAGNTAILGADEVFSTLTRRGFFPPILLRRNRLRGTPHNSIALATGIPILILIVVPGNITVLGEMYTFGLLGAFMLTCLGLDALHYHDWKAARTATSYIHKGVKDLKTSILGQSVQVGGASMQAQSASNMTRVATSTLTEGKGLWFKIKIWLGIVTTVLVILAWFTNLITKPIVTGFGTGAVALGMTIVYIYRRLYPEMYTYNVAAGAVLTEVEEYLRRPSSVLAVLTAGSSYNDAIIEAAIKHAGKENPPFFLHVGKPVIPNPDNYSRTTRSIPNPLVNSEAYDIYLGDPQARAYFEKVEDLMRPERDPTIINLNHPVYIYLLEEEPDVIARAWHVAQSRETLISPENEALFKNIGPDNIWSELTPKGKVVHLLKR